MSPKDEIHVGDEGTILRLTVYDNDQPVDLSTATTSIVLCKPDAQTITKAGTFFTDGTDGIVQYTVESDILDMAGVWKIQVVVTMATGKWSSSVARFTVCENL